MALTDDDIDAVSDGLVKILGDVLPPLRKRIEALEQRPEIAYHGVYVSDQAYVAGSLVTRSGGLWLCLRSTTQAPGQSGDWKLIVKRGDA